MNRVLVLGAGGMLGHKVVQRLSQSHEVVGTLHGSRNDMPYCNVPFIQSESIIEGVDAADFAALHRLLKDLAPQAVVNCVGVIKQRPEAKSPIPSITINSLLPHVLAGQCAGIGARLIHFSTDCVFSGLRGNYTEDDVGDAEDLYGRSKYLGEVGDMENTLTLRTSIVGRELRHFQSLIEWFLSQEGSTVKGYRRAVYSGVTTNHMAGLIARLVDEYPDLHGLYQVAGPGIDKYRLLQVVKQAFDLDVIIEPDDEVVIDRSLSHERFSQATGVEPPSWEEMITEMAADPTPYEEWR